MRSENITINGVTYTITEIAHKDATDLFEAEQKDWINILAQRSVTVDGEPLPDISELGLSVTFKLFPKVAEFYGVTEGND